MNGSHYSDEDRRQAVIAYQLYGTGPAVEQHLGIPRSTLCEWRQEEWWSHLAEQVRTEVVDEIQARTLKVARKCLDSIDERLENGDTRYTRTGQLLKVPVSARDAAVIFAIAFDKRQLLLNRATSINESRNVGELAGAMLGAFKEAQARSALTEKTIEGEADVTSVEQSK